MNPTPLELAHQLILADSTTGTSHDVTLAHALVMAHEQLAHAREAAYYLGALQLQVGDVIDEEDLEQIALFEEHLVAAGRKL